MRRYLFVVVVALVAEKKKEQIDGASIQDKQRQNSIKKGRKTKRLLYRLIQ
jgi:hypothetical protein